MVSFRRSALLRRRKLSKQVDGRIAIVALCFHLGALTYGLENAWRVEGPGIVLGEFKDSTNGEINVLDSNLGFCVTCRRRLRAGASAI
jgi:hypothetical protein